MTKVKRDSAMPRTAMPFCLWTPHLLFLFNWLIPRINAAIAKAREGRIIQKKVTERMPRIMEMIPFLLSQTSWYGRTFCHWFPLGHVFPLKFPLEFPLKFPLGFPLMFPLGFPLKFPLGFPLKFPLGFPLKFPLGFPLKSPLGFPLKFPKLLSISSYPILILVESDKALGNVIRTSGKSAAEFSRNIHGKTENTIA